MTDGTIYDHGLAATVWEGRSAAGPKQLARRNETWTARQYDNAEAAGAYLDDIVQPGKVLTPIIEHLLTCSQRQVIIIGEPGTGKSQLLAAIAREQFLLGSEVIYATAPELIRGLSRSGKLDMDALIRVPRLYIDDVGAEPITARTQATLFELINGRDMRHLPTSLSSNFTVPDLAAHLGDRVWSRIKRHHLALQLLGEDRREPEHAVNPASETGGLRFQQLRRTTELPAECSDELQTWISAEGLPDASSSDWSPDTFDRIVEKVEMLQADQAARQAAERAAFEAEIKSRREALYDRIEGLEPSVRRYIEHDFDCLLPARSGTGSIVSLRRLDRIERFEAILARYAQRI